MYNNLNFGLSIDFKKYKTHTYVCMYYFALNVMFCDNVEPVINDMNLT